MLSKLMSSRAWRYFCSFITYIIAYCLAEKFFPLGKNGFFGARFDDGGGGLVEVLGDFGMVDEMVNFRSENLMVCRGFGALEIGVTIVEVGDKSGLLVGNNIVDTHKPVVAYRWDAAGKGLDESVGVAFGTRSHDVNSGIIKGFHNVFSGS